MPRASAAPPRRKSCGACVAAKRRCDLAVPVCSRCLRRDIVCEYPARQSSANPPSSATINCHNGGWQIMAPVLPISIETPAFPQPSITDRLEHVDPDWNSIHGFEPNISINPSWDLLLSPKLELVMPRIKSPRPLSEIIASKLQFAVDVLKKAPSMMVLETQLPWCHPKLYNNYMPRAMQGKFISRNVVNRLCQNSNWLFVDAYSCCSLYMSRNETNTPVIMSLLDARAEDLLSSPQPTSLIELLAHAHALLLYQIMRLFAGDVRSHATANTLFGTLEATMIALSDNLYFPDPSISKELLPLNIDPIIEFWEWWILQESARRTMLLTFYFIQIYKVLRGDVTMHCDGKLGLSHSWYLSAQLWNAQSAFDFAVAWSEKDHFVVHDLDFTAVLENAQPDEVDLFGRMLMVTLLGIDGAKAWFYAKGAIM